LIWKINKESVCALPDILWICCFCSVPKHFLLWINTVIKLLEFFFCLVVLIPNELVLNS
jgi:hypothetical protein